MRRILVPVDFSDVTDAVMDTAVRLAQAFESALCIVHVAPEEPDFVGYDPGPQSVRQAEANALQTKHKRLEATKESLTERGLDAEALLVQGPTLEKILEKVSQLDANLVVMGSHGHTALYELLVGSITEGVLRRAPCPVLVVPSRKC
jgi:nucleotide-binding universal stress UspA family protein